jgi:GDP-L-fucose synthase
VRATVYPAARIVWDDTKPDGAPRKLLDVSRLHALGWTHRIALGQGIEETYRWFSGQTQLGDLSRDRQLA